MMKIGCKFITHLIDFTVHFYKKKNYKHQAYFVLFLHVIVMTFTELIILIHFSVDDPIREFPPAQCRPCKRGILPLSIEHGGL